MGILLILMGLGLFYASRKLTEEVYRILSLLFALFCLIWGVTMSPLLIQLTVFSLIALWFRPDWQQDQEALSELS